MIFTEMLSQKAYILCLRRHLRQGPSWPARGRRRGGGGGVFSLEAAAAAAAGAIIEMLHGRASRKYSRCK